MKDIRIHLEVLPDEVAFGSYAKLPFEKAKQEMGPYRDAIAHADMNKSTPKTTASALDLIDVWTRVPAMRFMARVALENTRATLASTSL
jgi:hypothetical protein